MIQTSLLENRITMSYFLIGFAAVVLALFAWSFLIESIFCRNSLYPSPNQLEGVKEIFLITIRPRSYPANFEIFNDAGVVCSVSDKRQLGMPPNKIHMIHFKGIEFGVRFNTLFRYVELFEKNERIAVFRQNGFSKNIKFLTYKSRDLTLIHPEKWNPDLEVFENGIKLARITYAHDTLNYRNRKIFFFQKLDPSMEVVLCITGIFSQPKFGRNYLG